VTKGELFTYGIKRDDECCFCGGKDSIGHTFIHCSFTKSFVQKATLWFNTTNNSQISPNTEELLFGIITNSSGENNAINKFNYTTLFMRYYIYSSKFKTCLFLLMILLMLYNKDTCLKIKQELESASSSVSISPVTK